jgi:hypothetical protein
MNEKITLATLAAIVACFLALLIVVSINPALVDKTSALGAGVVLGGLLGALNTSERRSSPADSQPPQGDA